MAKQDRWYSSPTQIYWCCKALAEGRTLTHKTEIREVKGWRLAAIIEKLKKQFGWPIVVDYRGPEAIAHYHLEPGTNPALLRYPPSAQPLAEGGGA